MPMTHASEIGAQNPYQKTTTINRHENRASPMRYQKVLPEKSWYQIAYHTRQKMEQVFGTDFW